MGTSVTGTLTTEQMQQEAAKQQAMANVADAPAAARKFQFFAAFDGTNNDKNNLSLSGSSFQTNVANLFKQVETVRDNGATNLTTGYYKGVGTGNDSVYGYAGMTGLSNKDIRPSKRCKNSKILLIFNY
jgi:hypothetical protein